MLFKGGPLSGACRLIGIFRGACRWIGTGSLEVSFTGRPFRSTPGGVLALAAGTSGLPWKDSGCYKRQCQSTYLSFRLLHSAANMSTMFCITRLLRSPKVGRQSLSNPKTCLALLVQLPQDLRRVGG